MNDLEKNESSEVPEEDAEIYYTASGRIVYGGGGITPDVVIAPEYYTDLQRRLEANAFAFSFAVDAFKNREVTEDFETSDEILGVHIIGPSASELIAECVVTMEFHGASEDLARIVHAHPTLSEAVHEAALHVDKRAIHRGN